MRASWPTSYGNLASRSIAMIVRYREGVVADGELDGALRAEFEGLGERVSELIDRVELTSALDEIWRHVRRLNRYVEEQAPWRLAKDPARAGDLDRVLGTLAEGLRVVSVLLHPYLPDSTVRLLAALGAPDLSLGGPSFGAPWRGGAQVQALEPLFPKDPPRGRHDRQPHPPGPVRAAKRRAGRGGRGGRASSACSPSARRRPLLVPRSRRPRTSPRCTRRSAATPTQSHGFDDADLAELRALAAHERCVAIGETGLDFYREGRLRAPTRQRAFAAQIALARETGKPLVIHTRAADEETLAKLATKATGMSVVMHCFSMPDRLEECVERGYMISFAGNVTYKSAADLADAARRVPEERLLIETDAPYLTPQAVRKQRNQPAFVAHTAAFLAELRGVSVDELGRHGGAQRRARVSVVSPHTGAPGGGTLEGHALKGAGRQRRAGPAEPAAHAPVRDPARSRARPELPDRLEHPRRDRARRRAWARGRGARDRWRVGRALGAPGERAKHVHVVEVDEAAARGAVGRDRRARQRERALGGRDDDGPRCALARSEEGRGEPPLRRGGGGAAAHDRGAAGRRGVGRDGAAEVGERLAAAPGSGRVRRSVGDRAAGLRGSRW